jgi:hypothetical protein
MELKNDFSDGDVLYSKTTSDPDGLNGITNTINITGVPMGSYFAMLTLGSGQTTSTTTNQLIDSAATFTDYYIGKPVFLGNEIDSTNYSQNNDTWTLKKTWTLDATESIGLYVTQITNGLLEGQCYYKLYYTDSTTANTNTQSTGSEGRITVSYINPEPLKKVWKIELWLRYRSSQYNKGQANNHLIYFNEKNATVVSRTSASILVLDKDIFLYTGSNYQFMNFAPGLYEPCDGTTVENAESPIFGLTKPDIANNYIRVL